MKKLFMKIAAIVFAAISVLSCAACGASAEIPKAPNYKRTLSNNKQFVYYAYSGVNGGSTEIKGYDWYTGRSFITLEHFKQYKDNGFDVIMPQSLAVTKEMWDLCLELGQQADLKVLLNDGRIYQGVSKDPNVVGGKTYTSDKALDADVQTWMSDYMDHPAFYGIMLSDEVKDYELDGSYGKLYKSVRRVLDANGLEDAVIHANAMDMASYASYKNHNPETRIWTEISRESYCEVLDWDVEDFTDITDAEFYNRVEDAVADAGALSRDLQMELMWRRYGAFCDKFFEKTGAKDLAIDWYPLYDTAVDYMITSLQVAAESCKKYDAELRCVAQSNRYINKMDSANDARSYSEDDMRWMNDIMLAFGVKSIMYFCYYVHPDDNTAYFLESCSFVTWYGEQTNLGKFMEKVFADNQRFAPTILNFKYQATKIVSGNTRLYQEGYARYAKDCGEFTVLEQVKTDKETSMITELYHERKNNYMYGVVNLVDPINKGAPTYQTVTLTFSDKYDYAVIWKEGQTWTVALDNHSIEIENAAGETTFVMPYYKKY